VLPECENAIATSSWPKSAADITITCASSWTDDRTRTRGNLGLTSRAG
jgi:hypothetical protein